MAMEDEISELMWLWMASEVPKLLEKSELMVIGGTMIVCSEL